jgi:hypothetical protein
MLIFIIKLVMMECCYKKMCFVFVFRGMSKVMWWDKKLLAEMWRGMEASAAVARRGVW